MDSKASPQKSPRQHNETLPVPHSSDRPSTGLQSTADGNNKTVSLLQMPQKMLPIKDVLKVGPFLVPVFVDEYPLVDSRNKALIIQRFTEAIQQLSCPEEQLHAKAVAILRVNGNRMVDKDEFSWIPGFLNECFIEPSAAVVDPFLIMP